MRETKYNNFSGETEKPGASNDACIPGCLQLIPAGFYLICKPVKGNIGNTDELYQGMEKKEIGDTVVNRLAKSRV